jgi:hypothetical protein
MNEVIIVSDLDRLQQFWSFFYEGFRALADNPKIKFEDTEQEFQNVTIEAMTQWPEGGLVAVLVNKKDQPLAFGVMRESTLMFKPKTCFVYAVYSNELCKTAIQELNAYGYKWARKFGYKYMDAATRRMTGGAGYWFKKKMGMNLHFLHYRKEII